MVSERAYFYFMKNDPAQVREATRQHVRYWAQVDPSEWRRGPFSDRSGGLIIFDAPDEKASEEMVAADPFQRARLLEHWWLKPWEPGGP